MSMRNAIVVNKSQRQRKQEGGYILVTLMLFVALLAMGLAATLPELTFQMKRDREEEMVHRGVQYTRAVRAYYRKFGGYPPSIDLLESSNNLHFLRKRYKDPVTGEDFKFLHVTDVKLTLGGSIAGGQNLAKPIGGTLNTGSGSSSDATSTPTSSNSSDASSDKTQDSSQQESNKDATSNSPFTSISGQSAGQTFGGGPIVGVASTSKKESIRIYNKKDHYNDWQFIYDPSSDRGGLITGPYQPSLQALLPGQNGLPNSPNGFGGMVAPNQGFIPGAGSPGTQSNPGTMQH
jgi:type II secretory pathway pseudopilin PulG